jgi:hypothetical protein
MLRLIWKLSNQSVLSPSLTTSMPRQYHETILPWQAINPLRNVRGSVDHLAYLAYLWLELTHVFSSVLLTSAFTASA